MALKQYRSWGTELLYDLMEIFNWDPYNWTLTLPPPLTSLLSEIEVRSFSENDLRKKGC